MKAIVKFLPDALCVLLLLVIGSMWANKKWFSSTQNAYQNEFATGTTYVEPIFANRPRIVFLLNSNCVFCNQSVVAIQKILDRTGAAGVGLFAEERVTAEAYLQSNSLALTLSQANRAGQRNTFRTPTVLILDKNAKILYSHVGRLDESVVSAVTKIYRTVAPVGAGRRSYE